MSESYFAFATKKCSATYVIFIFWNLRPTFWLIFQCKSRRLSKTIPRGLSLPKKAHESHTRITLVLNVTVRMDLNPSLPKLIALNGANEFGIWNQFTLNLWDYAILNGRHFVCNLFEKEWYSQEKVIVFANWYYYVAKLTNFKFAWEKTD